MRDALISLDWPTKGRADRVLEVLAGFGRNYSVLAKMFRNIEMLDGSEEMVKRMPDGVTKHQQYIENFKWPDDHYDCVIGVWCLCYLKGVAVENALAGMEKSIKEIGYIILQEPVLVDDADYDEEDFVEEG